MNSLTIGGDKDGQSRITRVVESWYNTGENTGDHIVTTVVGANHFSVCTGEAPTVVKKLDLQADISSTEAQGKIADILIS